MKITKLFTSKFKEKIWKDFWLIGKRKTIEQLSIALFDIWLHFFHKYLPTNNLFLFNFLGHKSDEDTQMEVIRLLLGMLASLTTEQLSEVLPLVASLQQNEYSSVRELAYDIFIWVYENCRYDFYFSSFLLTKLMCNCISYIIMQCLM